MVAEILGSGLDAVIGRMGVSNVTVEEMGLRICGRVLASPDSHAAERAEAVGWVLRHLSGEHAGIPISHSLRNPRPLRRAKVLSSLLEYSFLLV